ncbi:MAG: response regulator [Deltaproteobacteria bacterium]|nr:response regulator [Deltaproteobacteria bacterium]
MPQPENNSPAAGGPSQAALLETIGVQGARLETSLKLLAAIHGLTSAPLKFQDLGRAAAFMLQTLVRELEDVTNTSVLLYEPASDSLKLLAAQGQADLFEVAQASYNKELAFRPGQGVAGTVFAESQPRFWNPDSPQAHLLTREDGQTAPSSLACLPLLTSESTTIGVMNISFGRAKPFDLPRQRNLFILSGVVANVIQSFILQAELGRKAASLEEQVRQREEEIVRRQEAQRALAESQAQMQLILDHSPSGVAMFDQGLGQLFCNRQWWEVLAETPPPPGHQRRARPPERWLANHQAALAGGQPRSEAEPFPRPDGRLDWVKWAIVPWRDAGGVIGGTIQFLETVTARVEAELALERSRADLAEAQRIARLGSWTADLASGAVELSDEARRIFGQTPADPGLVPGTTMEDFCRCLAPGDRGRLQEDLARAVADRRGFEGETVIQRPDGAEVWVHLRAEPLYHDFGPPSRLMGTVQDITARREAGAEKERLEKALRQAQKMEAVGTLAGGIAHDFNNILQTIMGYVQLARSREKISPRLAGYLQETEQAAERASELVKGLLTFSRKVSPHLGILDLNQVVEHTLGLLRRTIPKMIHITAELPPAPVRVQGDANQLEQVLLNLAANSRDAMPEGGVITVATGLVTVMPGEAPPAEGLPPGTHAFIAFADTGLGIDPETQKQIFDPFFTTKGVGQGTGLGLAMVYGIIKSFGGAIVCESAPGQGATFRMYFRVLAEPEQAPVVEAAAHALPARGSEGVLLVDDEPQILVVGREVLEEFGYRVFTAESGEAALEVYERRAPEIDLVVLDLGMPGMGGGKCLARLKEQDPGLKVLVASGYSGPMLTRQETLAAAQGFLPKPYKINDMVSKIREILES